MDQLSDEEVEVREEEEDSDKEDQDLDKMFGAWLGELDKLTQVHTAWRPDNITLKFDRCMLKRFRDFSHTAP